MRNEITHAQLTMDIITLLCQLTVCMIHAAMEPVQVVSAVQIKSFLGMDFERFRCWEGSAWPSKVISSDQAQKIQACKGWTDGLWLVDSCKALNASNMEGLPEKKRIIRAWASIYITWNVDCNHYTTNLLSEGNDTASLLFHLEPKYDNHNEVNNLSGRVYTSD